MNILELQHNFELDLGNVIRYGSFKYALYKQKLLAFLFESISAFLQLFHILAILQLFSHIKSNLFYTYVDIYYKIYTGKLSFGAFVVNSVFPNFSPWSMLRHPAPPPNP